MADAAFDVRYVGMTFYPVHSAVRVSPLFSLRYLKTLDGASTKSIFIEVIFYI